MAEEPSNSNEAFSINDWDIEKSIFNMVVALVHQKAARMGQEAARLAVKSLLESMIHGLEAPQEVLDDRIQSFLHEQRNETE